MRALLAVLALVAACQTAPRPARQPLPDRQPENVGMSAERLTRLGNGMKRSWIGPSRRVVTMSRVTAR